MANVTDGLHVFHIAKRHKPYQRWEPIYIGTQDDPLYDERLTWEGKSDKMTQVHFRSWSALALRLLVRFPWRRFIHRCFLFFFRLILQRVTRCVCWTTTLWYWTTPSWCIDPVLKYLVGSHCGMPWLRNSRPSSDRRSTESSKSFTAKTATASYKLGCVCVWCHSFIWIVVHKGIWHQSFPFFLRFWCQNWPTIPTFCFHVFYFS